MNTRNIFSWAVCLSVLFSAVAYAVNNNATNVNITLTAGSVQTTTTAAPLSSKGSPSQPLKNSTGKPNEDDCSDEEPSAEPEGAAVNGTDRQGKQITLGDPNDKYTHEGGKAEPEPEGEPNGNSTSAAGKLTGNATTTARPAHGSASALAVEHTCGLGMLVGAIFMRIASL